MIHATSGVPSLWAESHSLLFVAASRVFANVACILLSEQRTRLRVILLQKLANVVKA